MSGYRFTAARRAALRRAQLISARKRAQEAAGSKARGRGVSGLKRNTVPYARLNKRSSTVGVNAGTVIPGTQKRIVIGGYARLESTSKETKVDKVLARATRPVGKNKITRKATGIAGRYLAREASRVRVDIGRGQARVGTSRSAGPTVVYRLGRHKTPTAKSVAGVQKYQKRMNKISSRKVKAKKPRPQRRGR